MSYVQTKTTMRKKAAMLPFRKITLADRERVNEYIAQMPTFLCEHCFVDLFIWKDHYNTEICFYQDCLLVRCESFPEGIALYLAPIGQGDWKAALEAMRQDAATREVPFMLSSITQEQLAQYQDVLGEEFAFSSSEDAADYIYLREKLQTLSGKKLQSKRNLVNRFMSENQGRWEYVAITADNVQDAYAFHLEWCRKNGCQKSDSFKGETCAIYLALQNWDALDLCGGMLLLDGRVIAFTLGCQAREDLFIVQIEKADADISGAYQMINQQFVKANCADVTYINREEDLGIEGLRKAKRSYYPAFYGVRYTASRILEEQHDSSGTTE